MSCGPVIGHTHMLCHRGAPPSAPVLIFKRGFLQSKHSSGRELLGWLEAPAPRSTPGVPDLQVFVPRNLLSLLGVHQGFFCSHLDPSTTCKRSSVLSHWNPRPPPIRKRKEKRRRLKKPKFFPITFHSLLSSRGFYFSSKLWSSSETVIVAFSLKEKKSFFMF